MKIHESGSLWNGDRYNICSSHGYFVLEVNDEFYCSGDNLTELYDEIEEIEREARKNKIKQMS